MKNSILKAVFSTVLVLILGFGLLISVAKVDKADTRDVVPAKVKFVTMEPEPSVEPTIKPTTKPTVKPTKKPKKPKKRKKTKVKPLRNIGTYMLTAYCPCRECSGHYGNNTATGVKAKANHTIAVDPEVIPYGTVLWIKGKRYVAEDCGGAVKGNHIDIYFDTHAEVMEFGKKYADVYEEVR